MRSISTLVPVDERVYIDWLERVSETPPLGAFKSAILVGSKDVSRITSVNESVRVPRVILIEKDSSTGGGVVSGTKPDS